MSAEPILYDPDTPISHYEKAGKLYKKVRTILEWGIIMPIAAFPCGAACIIYDPWLMAVFALFAIPFTLLAIIGCKTRRAPLCFVSVPLACAAAITAAVSGSIFAAVGLIVYLVAAFVEFRAISAVSGFLKLKELPGFPFFDPSMDGLTFAALDRQNADEFIEGELNKDSPQTAVRFRPEDLNPSEDMEEIVTGVSLVKEENGVSVPSTDGGAAAFTVNAEKTSDAETSERPYEKMMKIKTDNKNKEISDIELFG